MENEIPKNICDDCAKNPCRGDKCGLNPIIACVSYEKKKPKIGDKVYCAMADNFNIFVGIFEEEVDLFAPYGVRLENGELKYFMRIEKFL